MTHFNPNDPDRETVIVEPAPVYSETTETVIVRESNTGWWIAGILGGLVLLAVMIILFNRQAPQTDDQLLAAEAAAAQSEAEAEARQAAAAGQIAGAGARARGSRDDERQADKYGVRYTAAAGYDPHGLITLFEKMARLDASSGSSLDRFLASHPATDERIARIEGWIDRMPGRGERHAERYRKMTQMLR